MKRHLLILSVLLGLSAAVQVWCVRQAVVPAQDVVRLTSLARAIEQHGVIEMLGEHSEPPLFPLTTWLTHRALHPWLIDGPASWAASAQAAAAMALVLTVLPLYGLLLCLVRRRAAAVGAMFFCLIPVAARLGADGLADSTQLLLLTASLWAAAAYFVAIRRSRHAPRGGPPPHGAWRLLCVAGAFSAMAALAGKEALVLTPAIALALLLIQSHPAWRQSWPRLCANGVCLAVGMAVVLGPFLLASGATIPRDAAARLLGRPIDEAAESAATKKKKRSKGRGSSRWRLADGQRMSFDKKDATASLRAHGYPAAAKEFARELPKTFHYGLGVLALVGLWATRRRVRRPIDAFAALFFTVYTLAALHVASRSGYLAARHLLPILVLGIGYSAEGTILLGRWLRRRGSRRDARPPALRPSSFAICHSLGRALPILVGLACLPQTLAPLHSSRLGHRQAADWLAAHAHADAAVLDTRGWTGLLSGHKTYLLPQAKQALRDARLRYIVLERRELEYGSRRARTLRELLSRAGERVAHFPGHQPARKAVEIYRWHPLRFAARH